MWVLRGVAQKGEGAQEGGGRSLKISFCVKGSPRPAAGITVHTEDVSAKWQLFSHLCTSAQCLSLFLEGSETVEIWQGLTGCPGLAPWATPPSLHVLVGLWHHHSQ